MSKQISPLSKHLFISVRCALVRRGDVKPAFGILIDGDAVVFVVGYTRVTMFGCSVSFEGLLRLNGNSFMPVQMVINSGFYWI